MLVLDTWDFLRLALFQSKHEHEKRIAAVDGYSMGTGVGSSTDTNASSSAEAGVASKTIPKARRSFKDVIPQQSSGLQTSRVMSNGPVLDDLMKFQVRCISFFPMHLLLLSKFPALFHLHVRSLTWLSMILFLRVIIQICRL